MQIKFYDSLSRSKRDFVPLESNKKQVKIYSCGPTVYNYAHIGNMRAYLFMDTLRRVLRYAGYNVFGVLNITDVGHLTDDGDDGDDKIAKAANKANKQPLELAEFYTNIFLQDLCSLNIERPEKIVKATEHINEMIDMCKILIDKGFAYETDDGVYFDISKANDYGKLSGDRQGKLAGARIAINSQKHNPADFAVFKKAPQNHIMKWESPWGLCYPGWHIECSAMAYKYLGEKFDIHTGGIDHIPVHHENEIAQSEAFCGHNPANFWMHNEFMQVDGGKMSKSLGTAYRLEELIEKGFTPIEFRYFCHTTHYRKKLNFSWDSMQGSKTSYARLKESLNLHKTSKDKTDTTILNQYKLQFQNAITDDLNTPLGLGILHSLIKLPNSIDIYNLSIEFDKILGLKLNEIDELDNSSINLIPKEVQNLAQKRWNAKLDKDYATADNLRKQITELGYSIVDNKNDYDIIINN
ncbi:MAG: cysteine--tRNA ligase [Firmicutes bacterium]|nr:cysteine--tRNA ligase [Bacillota bacterium]MCL1953405.1 cysteine--tRNA ligase [Bacillota bacterium]